MTWQQEGACRGVDPDLFYPGQGASTREAKAVCAGCTVRQECLDYALANGEKFGIWGGLSERERKRLRTGMDIERRSWIHGSARCGTSGGYRRHARNGEPPCPACRDAHSRIQQGQRQLRLVREAS